VLATTVRIDPVRKMNPAKTRPYLLPRNQPTGYPANAPKKELNDGGQEALVRIRLHTHPAWNIETMLDEIKLYSLVVRSVNPNSFLNEAFTIDVPIKADWLDGNPLSETVQTAVQACGFTHVVSNAD
jgi:hypothetical protein